MATGDAERTLRELERVRHATRRTLHRHWFANLVFGVFFLGATLASAVGVRSRAADRVLGDRRAARIRPDRAGPDAAGAAIGAEARAADPALGIFAAIVAGVVAVNLLTGQPVAWAFPVAAGWLVVGAVYRDAAAAPPASRSR